MTVNAPLLPQEINTVDDLRHIVSVLTDKQDEISHQTNPQPQPQNPAPPTNVPSGIENQLSSMGQAVTSQINDRLRFIDMPPLFKKPAYFLDRLIPYFRMYLWIIMSTAQDPRATAREKETQEFKAYKFTILSDEDVDINNHLVSFKYTVLPGTEPNIEITVVDVKQEIIDVLALQFAKQGFPSLDIEYGWKVEPRVLSVNEMKDIYFHNTINVILMDVKPSFNNLGIPQYTFTGTANIALPGELRHQTPYSMFGRYPAIGLALHEILLGFQDKIQRWANLTANNSINPENLLYYILSEFLKTKYILDPNHIFNVIQKSLDYYQHKSSDITTSTTPQIDNPYKLELNDQQKIKFNRAVEMIIHSKAADITRDCVIAGTLGLAGTTRTVPVMGNVTSNETHETSEISPDGNTVNVRIITTPVTHSVQVSTNTVPVPAIYAQQRDALLRSNYLKDMIKTVESNDQTTVNNEMNDQAQFNINMRTLLLSEQSKPTTQQYFSNMYVALTSVLLEVGRIHPYYLYRYSINILHKKINKANATKVSMIEIPLLRIDYKQGDFDIPGGDPTKNIYPLREQNFNKFFDEDYDFKMTSEEAQQYGKLISEIACEPSTDWNTYLNSVVNTMKIRVNQPMSLAQARMYGVEQSSLTEVRRGVYTLPPLSLSCNFFVTTKDRAESNTKILQSIMQQRLQYMQNQMAAQGNQADQLLQKTIQSISTAFGSFQNITNSDKKWFMFFSVDILPTDSIFSAEAGLTRLVQAYSFRINGLTNNVFNPGLPYAAQVNFPDVIAFNPEFNYWQMQQTLVSNARTDTSTNINGETIVDERQKQLDTLLRQAHDFYHDHQELHNANINSVSSAFTQGLNQLQDKLTQIDNILGSFPTASLYAQDEPINFMVAQNYQANRVYTTSIPGSLDRKRSLQELRRRMMMTAKDIKGQLIVVGDPSFGINQQGKYIFFKMINQDNTLSYFTGLYRINNIIHEITAGKYTTTLDVSYDNVFNEPGDMQQLYQMSYLSDRQSVRLE